MEPTADSDDHNHGGFVATIKYSLSKLLFELIGTTFLTLIFLSGQGNVTPGLGFANFYA